MSLSPPVPTFEYAEVQGPRFMDFQIFVGVANATEAEMCAIREKLKGAVSECGCSVVGTWDVDALHRAIEVGVACEGGMAVKMETVLERARKAVAPRKVRVLKSDPLTPTWIELTDGLCSRVWWETRNRAEGPFFSLPVRLINRTLRPTVPAPRLSEFIVVDGQVFNIAVNTWRHVMIPVPQGGEKVVNLISAVTSETRMQVCRGERDLNVAVAPSQEVF